MQPWPPAGLTVVAGVGGPLLLGGTILALTLRQQAFLRSLGWDPLLAPTVDWPSGLALSPDGSWMVAAFLGSGALLSVFAAGLHLSEQHWLSIQLALAVLMALAPTRSIISGFAYDATEVYQGVTEVLAYGTAVVDREEEGGDRPRGGWSDQILHD